MLKVINVVKRPKTRNESRKIKLFCFPENFNVLDDLLTRRDKKGNSRYNSDILRSIVKETTEKLGYGDKKLRWSAKAGCSCGCSPGFISEALGDENIFITFTKKEDSDG